MANKQIKNINIDNAIYNLTANKLNHIMAINEGGTGQVTAPEALKALADTLTASDNPPLDNTYFITDQASKNKDGNYYRRPASQIWNYIKSKIDVNTDEIKFYLGTSDTDNSTRTKVIKLVGSPYSAGKRNLTNGDIIAVQFLYTDNDTDNLLLFNVDGTGAKLVKHSDNTNVIRDYIDNSNKLFLFNYNSANDCWYILIDIVIDSLAEMITNQAPAKTNDPTDSVEVLTRESNDLNMRPLSAIYNYIKDKLQSAMLAFTNTITSSGSLVLSKDTDARGNAYTSPALTIGGTSSEQHIEIDGDEIMSKSNANTPSTLGLQLDGGDVSVGNGGSKITLDGLCSITADTNDGVLYFSWS